jgi:N-acetylneuraminate synthase
MFTILNGKRSIGEGEKCFVIAEAGVNHNGSIERAKDLVNVAVQAGADAVKFQTFHSSELVTASVKTAPYVKKNVGKDLSQLDLISNLELPFDAFREIKRYCDKKKIIFLSTPHSFDAIDFLDELVPMFKFGSGDLTNIPSLTYAAKRMKPMILGTGMSTLSEVKDAVDAIRKTGNNHIVVLHCTSNYPCPINEVNMNAMKTMQEKIDCLIGYSDHTLSCTVPIIARSLGAVIIEKHFTTDRTLQGPDHKASLEPNELKKMVTDIRNVELALGSFDKKPTESELSVITIGRKSIIAKTNIRRGSIIKENMIGIKRPGDGIEPKYYQTLIGRKIKKNILKDEILKWDLIEEE